MQKAMANAQTIITDALLEIGVLGPADSLPPEDAALGLRKLNQILQRWSNLRLMLPVLTQINVPLNGGQIYSIGPSGDVVALRPLRVMSASSVDNFGTEYPCNVINQELWNSISVKNVVGGPVSDVWYEATNTDGRIHVYPKAASNYSLHLQCMVLLDSFTLSEDVALPEGYETALTLTLADDLASSYGRQSSPDLRRRATAAVRVVKRTNSEPLLMGTEAGMVQQRRFRIERGY